MRQRSNTSMSAKSIPRPDSRASTTSATSQNDAQAGQQSKGVGATYASNNGPEAALLQYHAGMTHHSAPVYDMAHQHAQHLNHAHAHTTQFPMPSHNSFAAHDSHYMPVDAGYTGHVRVGSVPVQSGTEAQDDKRRKASAVTATNDKELREMLAKNEGRPLRDVAHEVIQKERTPMAEKTKQLFAMLW